MATNDPLTRLAVAWRKAMVKPLRNLIKLWTRRTDKHWNLAPGEMKVLLEHFNDLADQLERGDE